ncbi:MAG: glycosyl hydrolase [Frankiales bacterium]|nr:glycosyl hydrolase [Frankiales bacterium]
MSRRRWALLTALALALPLGLLPAHAASAGRCGNHPWCSTSLSPDRRAALLQQAMTQDEEIQLLGGDVHNQAPHTGKTFPIARLDVPAVYLSDGPVGPRQGSATAMPIPLALAASFDPDLARLHGMTIALEAKAKGNDLVFAPTVNLLRNPQGGRSYEAYGEETYLVGQTGVSWIQGAQSTGVIANVKHFAANNQEGQLGVPPLTSVDGSRNLVNVNVDERTLREVYLPHFEAAVKQGGVGSIMCSYNKVNGPYACASSHLLQEVLQREWGFPGLILSDYGAAQPNLTADHLNNGLDFEPSGPAATLFSYNPQQIQLALATGQVTRATLDLHVRKMLRTFFAFGVFDRPGYRNDDGQIAKSKDNAIAERIEQQAITLLKNDRRVLPLSRPRTIAVIGPYADRFVTGGGSGTVTPFDPVTVLAGIRARAKGVTVTYDDGSDATRAAAVAAAADVAIVVVGDIESEGSDKACVSMNCLNDIGSSEALLVLQGKTCGQVSCPVNGLANDALVSAVAAANRKTVVVLETGSSVLTPWRDQVPAIVEAWYPGQAGGTAVARMLFGDADPGGRLPVTFAATESQLPTFGDREAYPGVAEQETYKEKLLVGYRWWDAKHLTPAFAFGHGLSYTSFRYRNLVVRPASAANQVALATVDVTNTGSRTGTAVPQLYVSKPGTSALPQPVRQLVGYTSLSLAPGRTARVTFPLNDRSFASWEQRWLITPGCYRFAAGASSRDLPATTSLGRGARCGAGGLPASGRFTTPLPAHATSRLLSAGPTGARTMPTGGRLPSTGGSTGLAVLGLLSLAVALAVAVGFEPTDDLRRHTLSRRAPSAARTRHRRRL